MLAGTEDTITPALNNQLQPFNQLRSSKYLLTAIGGTHLSIGDPGNLGITPNQSSVKERRGEETKPLRQLVQGVSLAFIEQLTSKLKLINLFLLLLTLNLFLNQNCRCVSILKYQQVLPRLLKWDVVSGG
jgi:predicted dienelactone hydrolase